MRGRLFSLTVRIVIGMAISTLLVFLLFKFQIIRATSESIDFVASLPEAEDLNARSRIADMNIMLVVIDTLAKKHTPAYCSEGRSYTPVIDKFAEESLIFSNAYSTSSWTQPAVASILTGLMPSQHGVKRVEIKLDNSLNTLPEILKVLGYKTYAVYSHALLGRKYGYDQGFDTYENILGFGWQEASNVISSERLTDAAIKQLKVHKATDEGKPFFFFAHYFDPHYAYQEHEEFRLTEGYQGKLKPAMSIDKLREMTDTLDSEDVEYLVNLHHEEIAYTDKHLGRLFEYMKEAGLYDNTMIILTADHGEEFLEHNWLGHTANLYQETINIPLMISYSEGLRDVRTSVPVSLIDILPTLISGGPAPEADNMKMQGIDLSPYLTGNKNFADFPDRNLIAEVDFKSSKRIKDSKKICIMNRDYKLIHDQIKNSYQLFRIGSSEGRNEDLITKELIRASELKQSLQEWKSDMSTKIIAPTVKIDSGEVEQLQSLGYM